MENESVFGVEPEQLKELLSVGEDEQSGTASKNEQSGSSRNHPAERKSRSSEPGSAIDAFIEQPGSWVGPYKLLRVLGEGGMGIAYLAEQKQPMRRLVALKIIKPGMDSKRVIARFEAERQALALLDHPNIAHVYDGGSTELGRPYFIMEYVKGMPITDYCDHHKLTLEERLELFLQACNAIHHAHQKGIIHRDIKPSNIVVSTVDDKPILKIIDFGVAKALSQPLTERTLITEQGQLFGTPEYMSPEQADIANEDIDTRSDIYSLGVLLYVLLTGVLPFDSKELRESGIEHIRQVIRETNPKTPSTRVTKLGEEAQKVAESRNTEVATLTKRLHNELEWIPLKAMRKDRTERYRSAAELADDIENYLNGAPLIAGPPTNVYRLRKFMRRHKALVTGVAAVLVVLLAGIFVSMIFAFKARQAEKLEASARTVAQDAQKAERYQRAIAEQKAEEYRRSLYLRNINLADKYYLDGKISRVRDLLKACPEDLRGWEWYYLWRVSDQSIMTLRGHEGSVNSIALSPDGRRIVSGGSDGIIRIWDAEGGELIRTIIRGMQRVVVLSPDGRRIFSGGSDGIIRIWDAQSGEELMPPLKGHTGAVNSLALSSDGSRVVSGASDWTIRIWDTESGEELMPPLTGKMGHVKLVAFSPNGEHIASTGDYIVQIFDAKDGRMLKSFNPGVGAIGSITFSPDGRQIAFGGFNAPIRIYDVNNYSELGQFGEFEGGGGKCHSIAFSPDGSRITAATVYATFKVWDTVSRSEMMTLKGHTDRPESVTFSPNGRRIVSGGADGTIKVWDLDSTGNEMVIEHESLVFCAVFSPDGRRIVSGGGGPNDVNIKVWDAVTGERLSEPLFEGHEHRVSSVTFSPDGRRLASASRDRTVRIWDAATGKQLISSLEGNNSYINPVAFSPLDGRRLASASRDGAVRILDVETGNELQTLRGHEGNVWSLAFSPDGSRLASDSGNTIKIWDVETGNELKTLSGHKDSVNSIAFSPDGSRIVSGSSDNTLLVWDANDYSLLLPPLRGHEDWIWCVAFSPNRKRIISCSDDMTVRIWDAESGSELLTLQEYNHYVRSAEFSPDGRRLVSAATYGSTIKIWDIASTEEVEAELLAEEEGRSWIRRD